VRARACVRPIVRGGKKGFSHCGIACADRRDPGVSGVYPTRRRVLAWGLVRANERSFPSSRKLAWELADRRENSFAWKFVSARTIRARVFFFSDIFFFNIKKSILADSPPLMTDIVVKIDYHWLIIKNLINNKNWKIEIRYWQTVLMNYIFLQKLLNRIVINLRINKRFINHAARALDTLFINNFWYSVFLIFFD